MDIPEASSIQMGSIGGAPSTKHFDDGEESVRMLGGLRQDPSRFSLNFAIGDTFSMNEPSMRGESRQLASMRPPISVH